MKLKQIKTYQSVEVGANKTQVNYLSLDNDQQTKMYKNLRMEIVKELGMVRIQFDGEDKLIPLANIAYASPLAEKASSEKVAAKAAK